MKSEAVNDAAGARNVTIGGVLAIKPISANFGGNK
jgi:hypothetical protein